jgi:imidazole glycerol-phosphate synthase subunit HisH
MKATVFDYGAGNLHSLLRALRVVGVDADVETDAVKLSQRQSVVVLPGVGAFGHAMKRLEGATEALAQQLKDGRPAVGICLGMQLLFDASEEDAGAGLGVVPGNVTRLSARRVPHMGWSTVEGEGLMYFAHSYSCVPKDQSCVLNTAVHETQRIAATVRVANSIGVQFHPEKSSTNGLQLLKTLFTQVTS